MLRRAGVSLFRRCQLQAVSCKLSVNSDLHAFDLQASMSFLHVFDVIIIVLMSNISLKPCLISATKSVLSSYSRAVCSPRCAIRQVSNSITCV